MMDICALNTNKFPTKLMMNNNSDLSLPNIYQLNDERDDQQNDNHNNNNDDNDIMNENLDIQDISSNISDATDGHHRTFAHQYYTDTDVHNKVNTVSPLNDDHCQLGLSQLQTQSPPLLTAHHTPTNGKDRFCWSCHKEKINVHCKVCPRSYHLKCIPSGSVSDGRIEWLCIECQEIMHAEDTASRSPTLSRLSVEELCQLLRYALQTIRQSADPSFHKPVSAIVFPDYHQIVHHPMDISTIEENIRLKLYGCTQSFLSDIKWILHNCTVYNNSSHPLTKNANYLARVARNEMAELEICPDCFKNFYTVGEFSFAEPCRKPHALVFARVKGYPLWPAKAVRLDSRKAVDCRFFGTHDRAWVTHDSCWFLSEQHSGSKPNKTHKSKFDSAMKELSIHIERLNTRFPGKFKYYDVKTPFDCDKMFICDDSDGHDGHSLSSLVNNKNINNTVESRDNLDTNIKRKPPPGIFSPSEKTIDEFKMIDIQMETNSFEVSNKSPPQNVSHPNVIHVNNEDANSKARTARVGKRNVAEALRASKVIRTSSSSSVSSPQSQNKNASINSNSSSSTTGSVKSRSIPLSSSSVSSSPSLSQSLIDLKEEIEMLRKQLSYENSEHIKEIKDIKQNCETEIREFRAKMMTEKEHSVANAITMEKNKAELEMKLMGARFDAEKRKLMGQVDDAKKKKWCAHCWKEARLFCCYDTWYCDYPCQKEHWKTHVNACQQIQKKQ